MTLSLKKKYFKKSVEKVWKKGKVCTFAHPKGGMSREEDRGVRESTLKEMDI